MTRSVCFVCSRDVIFIFVHVIITESVHVKLTDEEIRYLEEPYMPKDIIGHK
jgi:hypothetical protein